MYYLTVSKHFVSTFSTIFDPIAELIHFFIVFLTPYFDEILDPIRTIFLYL